MAIPMSETLSALRAILLQTPEGNDLVFTVSGAAATATIDVADGVITIDVIAEG